MWPSLSGAGSTVVVATATHVSGDERYSHLNDGVCAIEGGWGAGDDSSASPEAMGQVLPGRARRIAPMVTAANARIRNPPNTPEGTGSSSTTVPAAIGNAFVSRVATPATVNAALR